MHLGRQPMMTARSDTGIYFNCLSQTWLITGPPLSLSRIDYREDYPTWEPLLPGGLDLYDLRRRVLRLVGKNDRSIDGILARAIAAEQNPSAHRERQRHLTHLYDLRHQIIGSEFFRLGSRFTEPTYQFGVIYLAHRIQRYAQKLRTHPFLCALMIGNPRIRGHEALEHLVNSVRELCEMPHREVALACGFRPSCASVLGRFMPQAASWDRIDRLRDTLSDPAIFKLARHLPRISVDAAEILANPSLFQLITPTLLETLSQPPFLNARTPHVAKRLETLEVWLTTGLPGPRKYPHPPMKPGLSRDGSAWNSA